MNTLVDQMNKLYKYENTEDNLYVKNIIVNKDKSKKPIKIMEAQLGSVLKENDIVRYKDIYGRIN